MTSPQTLRRGLFIVFEGCDHTGKTTQAKLLTSWLQSQGRRAQLLHFPDRSTPIGQTISQYLSSSSLDLTDETIHLLFSANRWEKVPQIKLLLQSHTDLIVDRYAFSGVAFSCAKGLDLHWCIQPDVGLPRPDAVFYLKPSKVEDIAERGGFGEERYERVPFQKIVAEKFECIKDSSWQVFDVSGVSIEDMHERIKEATEKLIAMQKELGVLWK